MSKGNGFSSMTPDAAREQYERETGIAKEQERRGLQHHKHQMHQSIDRSTKDR